MDLISFDTGERIYRDSGDHPYYVGYEGIISVTPVRALPYFASSSCRQPVVKNLCGRFTTYLQGYLSHGPVSSESARGFGRHQELFHVHGTVTVHCGVAYFRGCAGVASVRALSRDLFFETPVCEVFMGVFKVCLGRRLDTSPGCFLESCVRARFRCLRVINRIEEIHQSVKLHSERYDPEELPYLTGDLVPSSLDVTVTGKGVVLLRLSWRKCPWGEDVESSALRFCGWLGDRLRECC